MSNTLVVRFCLFLLLSVEVGFVPQFELWKKGENGKEMKGIGGLRAENQSQVRREKTRSRQGRIEGTKGGVRGRRENKKNQFCNVIK
jgi:hypothetical protein